MRAMEPAPAALAYGARRGVSVRVQGGALTAEGLLGDAPLELTIAVSAENRSVTYAVVPRIVGAAGAGPTQPMLGLRLDALGDMAFTQAWIAHTLPAVGGPLASVRVAGDSMAPTLRDGETILIDRGVQLVPLPGIYVIQMRGMCLVKRLQPREDDTLEVISDNPAYLRETLRPGWEARIGVIGRVVWPRVS